MKKILVAAAVMACFGTAGAAEDITVDVAVIGAGGAGLSAAVQAHELGANVVVVEKMAMVGGRSECCWHCSAAGQGHDRLRRNHVL